MVCGKYTRDQIRILALTLTATALAGSAIGLPPPFLPKLDEKYNLSSAVTGWIIGTFPLAHLLCIPVIAKYVTKIGLYEVNVWGSFFNGGCTVILGTLEYFPPVEDGTNWPYVIIAFTIRVFQAIGASCWYNANMTILTISFPEDTTTVLGYAETVFCFGAMASPAAGSVLYQLGGFMGVFGGVGMARMVVAILMRFFLPRCQNTDGESGGANGETKSLKSILSEPRLTGGLLLLVYGGMVWAALEPILEPELRTKFELKTSVSAFCFIILAGTYAIATQFIAKSLDKGYGIDRILLMAIGLLIAAVAFLFAGPPPFLHQLPRPLWLLLLCVGLLGISCSILLITPISLLFHGNRTDGPNEGKTASKSTLAALYAAGMDLGLIIGPVVSGAITARTSFAMTTTWFCGFSVINFCLALILYHCTKIAAPNSFSKNSEHTLLLPAKQCSDV